MIYCDILLVMFLILWFFFSGCQENSEVKEIKEELSLIDEERLLSKETISLI